jgi:hypothetical protein
MGGVCSTAIYHVGFDNLRFLRSSWNSTLCYCRLSRGGMDETSCTSLSVDHCWLTCLCRHCLVAATLQLTACAFFVAGLWRRFGRDVLAMFCPYVTAVCYVALPLVPSREARRSRWQRAGRRKRRDTHLSPAACRW